MLTPEWRSRITKFRDELKNNFYFPLGSLSFDGFVIKDFLTPDQALAHEFTPMPTGTPWGGKWEYGWFRTSFTLPAEAEGKAIKLALHPGGELLVRLNGTVIGGGERAQDRFFLTKSAKVGTCYDLLIEAYAGHGVHLRIAGPTPPGRVTVPEPPKNQVVVGSSSFGVWEEDVFQLWLDVETLLQLRDSIEQNLLRVAEIDQGLRDFSLIFDPERPREQMMATISEARKRLAPLLACTNGTTSPLFFAVGHGHLDIAYMWPLAQTERKAAATFTNQMVLMDEYPEHKFMQSQPHLYWMLQQRYPDVYKMIMDYVRRGQLIADGGMWVEADTNITGGESLIRQFIHGKRFFKETFGVDNELLWLPDVFGYSGALPQIMRGCGIRYFATAKLFWTYNGGDPFPYNNFTWEGIDGSTVLAHVYNDYGAQTSPAPVLARWNERPQKDGVSTRIYPFGWSDGGGGPTREQIEFLLRQKDLEGAPRMRIANPMDFFHDLEERGIPEARYTGELYYQCHRGTYTTQARTKRGNRKSEFALREAEMWGSMAATTGFIVPVKDMEIAWRKVLLNQFHDIIPGSSINRVYHEAEASYAEAIDTANDIAAKALSALSKPKEDRISVFNSFSWPRTALVVLPSGTNGVFCDGQPLPVQMVDDRPVTEVQIPSCGSTVISLGGKPVHTDNELKVTTKSLENRFLSITLNDFGGITSIFDKEKNRELAAGICNDFRMYRDVSGQYEAWDLDSIYRFAPVNLEDKAQIKVLSRGPIVAVLQVKRTINDSTINQEISLRRGKRLIEFKTSIDWKESHKLLKVNFPVDIHANEAVHEIQFGHLRRPNHYSRSYDADRFEVSNQKWTALMEESGGAAILNDCKYGVNVFGNSINLTLLRSPLCPDMYADKCLQQVTYAFYAWHGSFAESDLIREAYEFNSAVVTSMGDAGIRSFLSVDATNVIVETVKQAEDGSGDIIVRLYESKRIHTRCTFTTALPCVRVQRTDMLEANGVDIPHETGSIPLAIRPFEIVTLRLGR